MTSVEAEAVVTIEVEEVIIVEEEEVTGMAKNVSIIIKKENTMNKKNTKSRREKRKKDIMRAKMMPSQLLRKK